MGRPIHVSGRVQCFRAHYPCIALKWLGPHFRRPLFDLDEKGELTSVQREYFVAYRASRVLSIFNAERRRRERTLWTSPYMSRPISSWCKILLSFPILGGEVPIVTDSSGIFCLTNMWGRSLQKIHLEENRTGGRFSRPRTLTLSRYSGLPVSILHSEGNGIMRYVRSRKQSRCRLVKIPNWFAEGQVVGARISGEEG